MIKFCDRGLSFKRITIDTISESHEKYVVRTKGPVSFMPAPGISIEKRLQ